jgi:type IV pilus assembly protein PilF
MKWLLPLVLLALAGCASQPDQSGAPEAQAVNTGATLRAQVHTDLAANYYLRGQYAVALQELNKATSADADYAPAYNIRGLVHGELREDETAEQDFRHALDLQSQYSDAHNNYGQFLCKRKRTKEAMSHFETALSNPLYATPEKAQSNAGACILETGDLAAAEMYFIRATKRAPDHASALLGLAEVDYRLNRWLPARALLRKLSDRGELGAQALWLGVRVERSLGDHDAETSYADQLRRRFPDSIQTQWLMVGQYDQMGTLL